MKYTIEKHRNGYTVNVYNRDSDDYYSEDYVFVTWDELIKFISEENNKIVS